MFKDIKSIVQKDRKSRNEQEMMMTFEKAPPKWCQDLTTGARLKGITKMLMVCHQFCTGPEMYKRNIQMHSQASRNQDSQVARTDRTYGKARLRKEIFRNLTPRVGSNHMKQRALGLNFPVATKERDISALKGTHRRTDIICPSQRSYRLTQAPIGVTLAMLLRSRVVNATALLWMAVKCRESWLLTCSSTYCNTGERKRTRDSRTRSVDTEEKEASTTDAM